MTIRLENVGRRVDGAMHLSGIDLVLEPGRLYVLFGRTHAGKTSLLRVLAGLDRPSEGRMTENGADLAAVPVPSRNVAFVYQQFVNYPSFSVGENIAAPLRRRGLSAEEISRRVTDVARRVQLESFLDRLPGQLSGGQQQRLAIARALAREASLMLFDEPLVNLDYKLREGLREELRGLFRQGRQIVVYATTEPEEALQMGGTTIVLHEGRVVQQGPAQEIYRKPQSALVASIFSEPPMNLVPARIEADRLRIGTLSIPRPAHIPAGLQGECRIGLQPHRVRHAESPGAIRLEGEMLLAEVDGSSTFAHFTAAGHPWVARIEGVHALHPGTAFAGHVDPRDLYVFAADGALVAPAATGGPVHG
ncbi:ABC transporter ATP-binding protein [Sinirhodobacter ferrireducens]|uniref:ABC transporter ATP-binding protein n=1 Tax=Paenirhodobacter ferrireducens TaxID=1215032 RepID=A0A443LHM4_9RHOB|nr:ABC transporter ATP-binding protein [Sinirhodobacter ferrireducens]RWR48669.1 ABC transporter ATP-binding protein [Sinirhodobacter ferrireducens]